MRIAVRVAAVRVAAVRVAGLLTAGVLLPATLIGVGAPAAGAAPRWASASTATIHPGIQTDTAGAQCTANFVLSDYYGNVYLGQAAHCAGTGGAMDTDGCHTGSHRLGTPVTLGSSGVRGSLTYSSWLTMRKRGERDANRCAYNDFALIRIPSSAIRKTNPSVPFWGGPTGINRTGTGFGDTVLSYGNSSLRLGLTALSPKQGTNVGTYGAGWSHTVYTVSPGIPGDSGSAYLDSSGRALGVLSTMTLLPLAGSNGVGDLYRELWYAQLYSGIRGLKLEKGTQRFTGPLL